MERGVRGRFGKGGEIVCVLIVILLRLPSCCSFEEDGIRVCSYDLAYS